MSAEASGDVSGAEVVLKLTVRMSSFFLEENTDFFSLPSSFYLGLFSTTNHFPAIDIPIRVP